MELEKLLDLFEVTQKKPGQRKWEICCPAHDDATPSCSLGIGDKDDRLLVKCHVGCTAAAICEAKGIATRDLFFRAGKPKGKVASYPYRDELGALLYTVHRSDPKSFSQQRADGLWTMDGVRRVLYRLPEILGNSDAIIWVVEGEKDVESLEALGLLATTHSGGAGKWSDVCPKALEAAFRGRRVVVLPDQDPKGQAHARQVVESLRGLAKSVEVVNLSGLFINDVSDWISWRKETSLDTKQLDTASIVSALLAEPRVNPYSNTENGTGNLHETPGLEPPETSEFFGISELLSLPEPTWLIHGILPAGLVMLYGPSGSGKSFIALDMLLHLSLGREWHGIPVEKTACCYAAGEGLSGLGRRVRAWGQGNKVDLSELVDIHFRRGVPQLQLKKGQGEVRAFIEAALTLDPVPKLVVVDTLALASVGAKENDATEMGQVVAGAAQIRDRLGATVVLVHHSGKDPEREERGSSALRAAMDAVLSVGTGNKMVSLSSSKVKDGERFADLIFSLTKVEVGQDSYGEPATSCFLERTYDEFTMKMQEVGGEGVQERTERLISELFGTLAEGSWYSTMFIRDNVKARPGNILPALEALRARKIFEARAGVRKGSFEWRPIQKKDV